MFIFSLYDFTTKNKGIVCSNLDEFQVYHPAIDFICERNLNRSFGNLNGVCRLQLKFGFESLNACMDEYDMSIRHVSIKKYVKKEFIHEKNQEELHKPVVIELNTADEIPMGVYIDFILSRYICDTKQEHDCPIEKFKTEVTWEIHMSGDFEKVLQNLKNLLIEHKEDKLSDIAIQFIMKLKKKSSNGSTDIDFEILKTQLYTFVVREDDISLDNINENDFHMF